MNAKKNKSSGPESAPLGIIGGSGLSRMDGFQIRKEHKISTPFGAPSDAILEGKLLDRTIFFLPRHGTGHRILPSEINFRANVYAMKKLGVRNVISVSAVGSLQKELEPGHFVLVDQFVDRTKGVRKSSFFGGGIVGHVSMAHPTCGHLASMIGKAADVVASSSNMTLHRQGSYLCIEGPNFSTRAESIINHRAGISVIGMTNVPEAYLAREAGICYCTIAMVTDYDSWNEHEEAVSVEAVIAVMKENTSRVKQLITRVAGVFTDKPECTCRKASQYAIMTDEKLFPKKTRAALKVILEP